MSTLICNNTGNLTGASTFAGAEVGALALVLNRNTIESLANNATVTSATFTVTNAKVIDGVLLWVRQGAAGSTGTFKVDLQKGGVSQASVTVNRADLPAFVSGQTIGMMVPVLFKLSSNATGDGGSNWTIVLTNSNGTNAVAYAAATASTTNFTRALRTTTAATPAAADDLYVVGELTGAGTHTSRTVTMDSTATTAYGNGSVNSTTVAGGGIHTAFYGTLAYGTTASTNYVLRINGDLWVWEQGPLSIGSSGSEIPRTSTAVLEFQQTSAAGDFGLRVMENATLNIAGLSRTSGKNIVKCKLTADLIGSCVLTSGPTATNGTNTSLGSPDPNGVSLLASSFADNATNSNHCLAWSAPSITNTTQVAQVWLARGSGTNNRFVRFEVGNNTTLASVTKGFFAEVDLQSGTIGTCTAVGTGTATSSSIAAVGGGFVCTITGKVDASAATPTVFLAAESATSTFSFAGASNQCFIYEGVQLVTAASVSTTLNVDTDTGWLSGDTVIVAATTRTPSDVEDYVLNANAGASSMTSALYPFGYGGPTSSVTGTHHGTSPFLAEVGLLTRNVKIRSTSSSLATYVYAAALATITASWAEFYYIGTSTIGKRSFEIDGGATCNPKSITFCSIHDTPVKGLYCNASGVASINLTFSNNVMYNNASSFDYAFAFAGTISSGDWTLDNNLLMPRLGGGFSLGDMTGTCTNNTVTCTGTAGTGFTSGGSAGVPVPLGTFSGNIAHTCTSYGFLWSTPCLVGTMTNTTSWRNNATGFNCNSNAMDITLNGVTMFGNTTDNITYSSARLALKGTCTLGGDTTFGTGNGVNMAAVNLIQVLDMSDVDMSGTATGLAVHTSNDISTSTSWAYVLGQTNNCKFGSTNTLPAKTGWNPNMSITFGRYNQTAGDHRAELKYGQLKTDTTFYNSASPSLRMTPNNASNKLESTSKTKPGFLVAVLNGTSVNITVYAYKSKTGDGAAYTGNQPRLIQKANSALGQSSDVVLATYSASTGSWNQLSATSSVATDDGVWEFIVDCDGTAGWINVDDWQAA
jgi:hypothetical protein